MSNIKFSQLPDLANITPATIIPVVSGGLNYTVTSANLQAYVNGGNGNITSGNITATGNVTGGNINTGGSVSATGNITANYFFGNGSQLTGLPQSYTNANVAAYLPTYTGNLVSLQGPVTTTANVTAAFFVGNGSALTGIATTGNFVDLTTNQTIGGNKTFTGTTTLNPYIETTAVSVNTGASFTPTMSAGPVQRLTANSSFTLNAPTGMVTGQSITLIIRQDATGGRLMTANAAYKFAYNVRTLSTTANSIDMMSIFFDGTNYLCNLIKGYV